MSLVPYSSRDSREIVLRHNDAIVIRDPRSKRLVLRGTSPNSDTADCPYCHQPIRPQSPERESRPASNRQESFVSPGYFRMLHLASDGAHEEHPPSSPIRRLVQPAFPSPPRSSGSSAVGGEEFITSAPAEPKDLEGQGIQKDAFSPNYFKRFFIEEKELGRGGKGVVLLVRHELDGVFLGHFACKRVPVGDDHAWLEKVLIEVQLLQRLSHPNLVSYRHVWLEDVKLNRFGPSVPCAFILQQYCNAGDLLHYIIGTGPAVMHKEQLKEQMRRRSKGQADNPRDLKSLQRKLAFEEIYSFFKDITSGLAHLHASNYIHRDLKPSNCLLHKSGNDFKCLISDFGEVQAEHVVRKSTGATGTISYCAPEVLKKDASGHYANFTTKSDIFSLGMILYFMCFARLPYSSADSIQEEFEDLDILRAEISSWSGFTDERQERPDLPDPLYGFLKRLLAIDPVERPSADEVLHAIRTETSLDSPPKVGRSSLGGGKLSIEIGKRIQPLDSPALGTPVPENGKRPSTQPGYGGEDSSSSPPNEPSSIDLPPKEPSEDFLARQEQLKPPQTPLLMPPPSTLISSIKTEVFIYRHRLLSWAVMNQQPLAFGAKVVIFVVKIYALTKPCLPLGTKPLIAYPLLLLAALDLGLGRGMGWRLSGLSIMVHFLILAFAVGQDNLCTGGRDSWEWGVE